MSSWWLTVVSVTLRANCTPVTLAPVETNSARIWYSPSSPAMAVPAVEVATMNDLLVSTAVGSVIRLLSPLVPPELVVHPAAVPPMHEVPRCTDAPS